VTGYGFLAATLYYVAWVERSDKIIEGDFGQPQAGPKGGVHSWTPQTRVSLTLNPGYASLTQPGLCHRIDQNAHSEQFAAQVIACAAPQFQCMAHLLLRQT